MRFGVSSSASAKVPETPQTLSVSVVTHRFKVMAPESPNTLNELGFEIDRAVKLLAEQGEVIVTYTYTG